MSQQNDTVKPVDADTFAASLLDAMNRRDLDALEAFADPEVEFHSRIAASQGRVYKGLEGLRDYLRDLEETFVDVRRELEGIVGWRGDDLVLMSRTTGRGRASGIPINQLNAQVWSFREGKIWRATVYDSKAEALEAAGP